MSSMYPLYRTLNTVLPYYAEERRHYHNFDHISAMLTDYARFEEALELDAKEEAILFDCILWHDTIYVIGAKDNEELSAELYLEFVDAMRMVGYTITEKHAAIVMTGIEYTAKHFGGVPDFISLDKPLRVLMDLDLMGFARPYDEFVRLQNALDREAVAYGHNPDVVASKRLSFLENVRDNSDKWLAYSSLPDCEELQQRAHDNLKKYLTDLIE